MHANAVAEIMGSFPVLVPPAPGLLCAIGDLVADFRPGGCGRRVLLDDKVLRIDNGLWVAP